MNFDNGVDGGNLTVGLALDQLGNLYGASFSGGARGRGLVFEIVRAQ